jgi:hypothetical protein
MTSFNYRPRTDAEWEARLARLARFDDDELAAREISGEGESSRESGEQSAVAFLEAWRPGGPWLLTAITPDPTPGEHTETCEFSRASSVRRWIAGWNGKRNVYFHPNATRPGLQKKAGKADIVAVDTAFVDLDPPKTADGDLAREQDRILDKLKGFVPRASGVVLSGGGFQAYWRYEMPVAVGGPADVARLEAVNLDLREALAGDATHDVSRILRLPGTLNLPDKKKREAGRVPVMAEVIFFDPQRRYRLEALAQAAREARNSSGAPHAGKFEPRGGEGECPDPARGEREHDSGAGAELESEVGPELAAIIRLGRDPEDPQRWCRADGTLDRNRVVYFVAVEMLRRFVAEARIAEVLLDRNYGVSEHVWAQQDPERAVWDRALRNARAELAQEAKERNAPPPRRERPHAHAADDGGLGAWEFGAAAIDPAKIRPRGWLLGTWLCRQFVSSLYADGGVGKTTIRLACALALATGRKDILELHVFERCRVLFVSFEDGDEELTRRMLRAMRHHGVDNGELAGWLYVKTITRSAMKLATVNKKGELVYGPLWGLLRTAIRTLHIDAVFLDPLIKIHGMNENDNNQMDMVMNALVDLAIDFDIAVDAPHHITKGSAAPGNADAGRGAGAVKNGGRLIYTATRMLEDDARLYGIDPDECGRYIRIDQGKVNLVPSSREPKWLKLVTAPLGNVDVDPHRPEGDQVQAVEPWAPPAVVGQLTSWTITKILDKIANGYAPGRRYSGEPQARERGAWHVVLEFCSDLNERQAKLIIRTWIKDGILISGYYEDPVERRRLKGVTVGERP